MKGDQTMSDKGTYCTNPWHDAPIAARQGTCIDCGAALGRDELGQQIEALRAELQDEDPLSAMFLHLLLVMNKLAERVNQLDQQASEGVTGLLELCRLLSDRITMLELDRKQGGQG